MDYSKIKKIDEESLKNMTEGIGPSDECLCSLLSPPEEQKGGFRASLKKAFSRGKKSKRFSGRPGQNIIDIPMSFITGGNGIKTTREVVKRKTSCGKCGCDDTDVVLNHSVASIRIVTPDISTFCPCPSDCIDKEKLSNNIQVTVEHCRVTETDVENSKLSLDHEDPRQTMSEPKLTQKKSASSLIEEYDNYEYESVNLSRTTVKTTDLE